MHRGVRVLDIGCARGEQRFDRDIRQFPRESARLNAQYSREQSEPLSLAARSPHFESSPAHPADNSTVDISVIIPTRGRPDKLARCIRALSRQHLVESGPLSGRFEVIVSIDGEDDDGSEIAARNAWDAHSPHALNILRGERLGINAARNRALEHASGRWTLFVNDDLYAQPNLLAQHVRSHLECLDRDETRASGAIIIGDAPWEVHPDDSLFDRIVRETSIIFFYDRMNASSDDARSRSRADYWKDWGFRNCYTLNLSAPTESFRAVGGFAVLPVVYGYDDLETGWRLQQRFTMPVLYRPLAKGTHDHRYTPDEYLAREHTLGRAAWHIAQHSPGCAHAIFGRDITSDAELDYSRQFVERERSTTDRLRQSFLELSRTPSSAVGGPASRRLINLIYEQHLLLKRWEWRRGLLESHAETNSLPGGRVHQAWRTPASMARAS